MLEESNQLIYRQTPVQDISDHPVAQKAGIRLLVKREDLNHPTVSGNKWWKLKYNLEQAISRGYKTVLTFGGAFSNHLYATSAAARATHLNSIGIIRGECILPLNKTLQFAADNGMILDYVDRQTYRQKELASFLRELKKKFGEFYLIPEGGTNDLAIKGCEEFASLVDQIPADCICLPVGTGGTMAGLLRRLSPEKKVFGFSVLQNGSFLKEAIEKYLRTKGPQWELITQYAYGGYGKRNKVVSDFIKGFLASTSIPLDFVYTGKMMCGILDLISNGYFKRGETIVAIHTGGLQGHSEL